MAGPAVIPRVARVYLGLVGAGAIVAAAVAVAAAAPVRGALDFGFGGVPDTLGEAWSIFVHNARVAIAVIAAAAAANGLWLQPGERPRVLRWVADALVVVLAVANVAVVGAAVGAYGDRMVGAMLPHGPLEILGFSVIGAVYLAARAGLHPRDVARGAAAGLALLAVAAVLEAYG
jgi:hypothetical protein